MYGWKMARVTGFVSCVCALAVAIPGPVSAQPAGDAGTTKDAAAPDAKTDVVKRPVDPKLREQDRAIKRARGLAHSKKFAEAKEAIEEVLKNNPTHLGALLAVGEVAEQEGRKGAAVVAFAKAVQLHPDEEESYLALADYYGREKDSKASMATLDKGIAKVATPTALLNRRALLLLATDRDKAVADFKQCLKLEPENRGALNNLATVYVQANRFVEAIPLLKKYVARYPNASGRLNLGLAYLGAGKLAEASAVYKELLTHRPGDPFSKSGLAIAQILGGEPDKAIETIGAKPEHPHLLYALGLAHLVKGDVASAKPLLSQAATKAPRQVIFVATYAECLRQAGQVEEADQLLRKLAQKTPMARSYVRAYRALVRVSQKRTPEAKAQLREALDLQPEYHKPGDLKFLFRMAPSTLQAATGLLDGSTPVAVAPVEAAPTPVSTDAKPAAPSSGCACTTVTGSSAQWEIWLGLGLLGLVLVRRRH